MRILECNLLSILFLALAVLAWRSTSAASRTPSIRPDADDPPGPVLAVVKVPRPWYAPDFLIVRRMRATLPQYRALPGLRFKAYSLARPSGDYGGLYLWRDRAAARAWFGPAWFERVRRERGVDAEVRLFALSGTPSFAPDVSDWSVFDHAAATLVVPLPGASPGEASEAEAFASLRAAGALALYPLRTLDGAGAAILWRDRASAQAWLDRAQAARRGEAGVRIEWYDTPLLMPAGEATATPVVDAVPAGAP